MVDKKIPYFSMFILIALLTLDYGSAIEQTSIAIERVEPYLSVAEITISRGDSGSNTYRSYVYELDLSEINQFNDLPSLSQDSLYSPKFYITYGFKGSPTNMIDIIERYFTNNELDLTNKNPIDLLPVETRFFVQELVNRNIISLDENNGFVLGPAAEHASIVVFRKDSPELFYDKVKYLQDADGTGRNYLHELFHTLYSTEENQFIPNEDPTKRVNGLAKTIWEQFPDELKEEIVKYLAGKGYLKVVEEQINRKNVGGYWPFYEEAVNLYFSDRAIDKVMLGMVENRLKQSGNPIQLQDMDRYIMSLDRGKELIDFRDKALKNIKDVIQFEQSLEHAHRNNQIYSQIFGSEIKMTPEEIAAYQYIFGIRADGIAGPETRLYLELLEEAKRSGYFDKWQESDEVISSGYFNSAYSNLYRTHLEETIPIEDLLFIYAHRDDMTQIVDFELAKNYNNNPNYQEYRGVFEDYLILIGKSSDEISEIMADPDKIKKYQLMVEAFPDGKIGPETAARALEAMGKEYEARTIAAQQELNNLLQEDFDFHNIQIRGADSPIISQEEMDAWLNQEIQKLPEMELPPMQQPSIGDRIVYATDQTVGQIPVVGGILTGGVNIIVGAAEAVGGFFENLWDSVVGESQTGDLALCVQICSSSNCESIGESWGCKCIYSCTPQGCMCYAQYSGT